MDLLLGQAPETGLQWTPSPQSQVEEQFSPKCRAGQLLLQLEQHATITASDVFKLAINHWHATLCVCTKCDYKKKKILLPVSLKAWLTDTSSCDMIAVTMETRTTQEAAGVSKCPVRAGLLAPGKETKDSFTNLRPKG